MARYLYQRIYRTIDCVGLDQGFRRLHIDDDSRIQAARDFSHAIVPLA